MKRMRLAPELGVRPHIHCFLPPTASIRAQGELFVAQSAREALFGQNRAKIGTGLGQKVAHFG